MTDRDREILTETYRIGVTGAAGYIGSFLTTNLLDAGHDVVAIDDFSAAQVEAFDGTDVHAVDVRDRALVRDTFDGVDAVCHLAAVSGVQSCEEQPEYAFDVNVGGTENVAWVCRETATPLVFPCSMAVVGDPESFPITADTERDPRNHYGRTKWMGETDVHQLAAGRFPAHVFVKSNLYGHHDVDGQTVSKRTVINIFVERALAGKTLSVHEPGTQARDFVHVKDVARAYEHSLATLLGDADDGATSLTLASGECLSILELAELVQRLAAEELGVDVDVELVENPRDEEAAGEDFTVDTAATRAAIGFETERTVEDTVREMLRAGDGGER